MAIQVSFIPAFIKSVDQAVAFANRDKKSPKETVKDLYQLFLSKIHPTEEDQSYVISAIKKVCSASKNPQAKKEALFGIRFLNAISSISTRPIDFICNRKECDRIKQKGFKTCGQQITKEEILFLARNDFDLSGLTTKFKDDETVMLLWLKQFSKAYIQASLRLQNDRNFAIKAVSINGSCLKYLSNEFKKDRVIVLEAVHEWGEALEFADKALQDDPEIVLISVKNKRRPDKGGLIFASPNLKKK